MQNVAVLNLASAFRKARSANQTSNGYVSKVPTLTEPAGDAGTATGASVIDLCDRPTGWAQTRIFFCPYAVGADNSTFSVRLVGWRSIETTQTDRLWVPVPLVELACTVSSACPGVAGGALVATEFFADTIAITKEPTVTADVTRGGTVVTYSPANDTIGFAIITLFGCQKLEPAFTTGGSATSCNGLLALL